MDYLEFIRRREIKTSLSGRDVSDVVGFAFQIIRPSIVPENNIGIACGLFMPVGTCRNVCLTLTKNIFLS